MSFHGHAWTLFPHLTRRVAPSVRPEAVRWRRDQPDPKWGTVELSGWLSDAWESRELLVVLHGLGGSSESTYLYSAAKNAEASGVACLRLNMRGADLSGTDVYHSGLSCDLAAAFTDPALAAFERIYVLGYSIGGHVALHYALSRTDPRVRGVAAICSPLDLGEAGRAFDAHIFSAYRHYVLSGLKRCYRAVAAKRAMSARLQDVMKLRSIREWDELVVAPRFGFECADHYYQVTSVGPRLGQVTVPCLYVGAERDPMVLDHTVHLERRPSAR